MQEELQTVRGVRNLVLSADDEPIAVRHIDGPAGAISIAGAQQEETSPSHEHGDHGDEADVHSGDFGSTEGEKTSLATIDERRFAVELEQRQHDEAKAKEELIASPSSLLSSHLLPTMSFDLPNSYSAQPMSMLSAAFGRHTTPSVHATAHDDDDDDDHNAQQTNHRDDEHGLMNLSASISFR